MSEPSDELRRFVEHTQLLQITFRELSARLNDDASAPDDDDDDTAVKPTYALTVDTKDDPLQFRLRLRTSLDLPVGNINVEVAAEYAVRDWDADDLTRPLVIEYANHVGVMALLPYIRHAIADLTLRVFGGALLMPVMPRGALHFTPPTDSEATLPDSEGASEG